MSAVEVADAIGEGLQKAGRPVDLCPVADGGEGTLQALLAAFGGDLETVAVSDPLGREIEASFALVAGARDRKVAVVEMAAASGLALVAEAERDAFAASTFGTGQLIAAAVQLGAEVVYVGVGGSATTDGGAGAIKAIRQAGGLRGASWSCSATCARCSRTPPGSSGPRRAPVGRHTTPDKAAERDGRPPGARPAGCAHDRRRGRSVRRPLGGVRSRARPGRLVHPRRCRVRPPDAGRAGRRHRRGQARRAEPGRKARVGDRDSRAPVRRALLRDRGQARAGLVRREGARSPGRARGRDAGAAAGGGQRLAKVL